MRAWGGQPVPAVVDRALEAAFQVDRAGEPVARPSRVAAELGMSVRTLHRVLREGCGLGPQELLSWVRVVRAVHQLESDPSLTVQEAAAAVGYADATGLGRALARRLGTRVEGARAMGLAGALERFGAATRPSAVDPGPLGAPGEAVT